MEPAQPPMNINIKKNTRGKFPHWSKSFVTYPVPVNIDITLKDTDLKPMSKILLFIIAR